MKHQLNVIIAGVGGQGNILASQLMAWTAVNMGLSASVGETYGASQRGGSVMSHIRIGGEGLGPLIPLRKAHILLGLEPLETLRVGSSYLNPESSVIMNTQPVYPVDVLKGTQIYPEVDEVVERLERIAKKVHTIDAVALAKEAGNTLSMNLVMIGALVGSGLTPFSEEDFQRTIVRRVKRLREINLKAFELGLKVIRRTITT